MRISRPRWQYENEFMIALVVAFDARRGIGINNTLPWRLPEDMAHFKRTTFGHCVIMGRKTFDSIGKALPGRRNIVITRNAQWAHEGVETATSVEQALKLTADEDAYIIGGAQIFALTLALADCLIVTEIERDFACDVFFPEIDSAQWHVTERVQGSQLGIDYAFVTYSKTF